jgi:hypothetical protein
MANIIFYASSFLFGMLGALVIVIFMNFYISPVPSIGTVNITSLVDSFIKQESQKNVSPDVLKQEVKSFGMMLEKELKKFSKKNHLVLLPVEAVIAGSHDYTNVIRNKMKSYTNSN